MCDFIQSQVALQFGFAAPLPPEAWAHEREPMTTAQCLPSRGSPRRFTFFPVSRSGVEEVVVAVSGPGAATLHSYSHPQYPG